jgi:hypothetical protein
MAPIVRCRAAWRAKWPINRANYTGCASHPLKRGLGGLVGSGRHGSMALVVPEASSGFEAERRLVEPGGHG